MLNASLIGQSILRNSLIIFTISNANSQTKATSDNEAKKRQILRNIANEAKKPSPDVQKRLMLRSIAQEVRKPQYIKFLNNYANKCDDFIPFHIVYFFI